MKNQNNQLSPIQSKTFKKFILKFKKILKFQSSPSHENILKFFRTNINFCGVFFRGLNAYADTSVSDTAMNTVSG